jgi:nucleoside-diphosphate-sugar epimerase
LCTAGTHRRDYLHVRDVASAIAAIVHSSLVGPVNVASGTAPPVETIATSIAAALHKSQLLRLGAIAPNKTEAPLVVANIDRLQNEVLWRPQISLESGLRDVIRWWSEKLSAESADSTTAADALRAKEVSIA